MGPDARRASIRSVLITDVHISGANCNIISSFIVVYGMCHQECVEVIGFQVLLDSLRPRSRRTSWGSPGATFLKLLRKILGRFLILGKSWENIPSTNLELANNNTIITVINSYFCVIMAVIM